MRRLLVIAFCLSSMSLTTAPAQAKSQREKATLQFEALWNARLNEYRTDATRKAIEHKAASNAIQSGAPFTFAPDDARLGRLITSSEDDARISGKGQELEAFLTHISSRPSLALSQAYLQGRVQKSQEADETATEVRNALDNLSRAKGVTIGQMLVAVERTAMAKGEAIGRFEELVLLIRNYGAYSADFAAANQRDRDTRARWAAALGAAASSMAARPTMSVSCTRFGNMVNCTGQ